jgi:hypothetical protein
MRSDPPVNVPTAPEGFSARALDLWVAETQGRTRSVGRRLLLEARCRHLTRADELAAIVEKEGPTVTTPRTGAVHAHPMIRLEQTERVAFVRLAKLLRLEWEFDVDGGRW